MSNLVQSSFDPQLFAEVLSGPATYRVAYRKAYLCPCKDKARGGPDNRCPVCTGMGYYWEAPLTGGAAREPVQEELTRAPVDMPDRERLTQPCYTVEAIEDEHGITYPPESVSVDALGALTWQDGYDRPDDFTLYTVTYRPSDGAIRALIQGVTTLKEFQMRGEFDVMDAQITVARRLADGSVNPAWDAGEHDRFLLLDTWRRHTQHVLRGKGGDRCQFTNVRQVTLRSLQDGQLREWIEGQDFTLQGDVITWNAGRGPALGEFYALEAQVSPEYFVFRNMPQTRHPEGKPMPRKFVLKAFEQFPNRRAQVAAPASAGR